MKRTKVEIDGMQFQVVGNDDSDYIRNMAAELTEKIEEVRNSNFRLNQVQSLLLTALNLLDERERARKQLEELSRSKPGDGVTKEHLEEMDRLKEELSGERRKNEDLEDSAEKMKAKIGDLEEKLRENSEKLNDGIKETKELKDRMKVLEGEKDKLEQGRLNAQKEIVDLNRQLSVLSEDEEE